MPGIRIGKSSGGGCLYDTEYLIEIYEQYKTESAKIIADMSSNNSDHREDAVQLHSSLLRAFEGYDFCDLTLEQAQKLGMVPFDDYCANPEDRTDFLMLFPLWMFPIIPSGIELTNIFEVKIPPFKNRKLRKDTRGGLLAYGMMNYQFRYKRVLVEKRLRYDFFQPAW